MRFRCEPQVDSRFDCGTREDSPESLVFAAEGKVTVNHETAPLEDINQVFERMKAVTIDGRVVVEFA